VPSCCGSVGKTPSAGETADPVRDRFASSQRHEAIGELRWPAQSVELSRAMPTVLTRSSAGRTPQISSACSTPGAVPRPG